MRTQAKGLTSTSLSLLAAAAGSGKTGIAMGIARALVDQGIPVEPFKAFAVINLDDDPAYQRSPVWQAGILHNCGAARLPVKPWHNPVAVIRSHYRAARGELYISGDFSGSVPTREEDLLHIADLPYRLRRQCRSAVHDAMAHVRASDSYLLVEGAGAAGELPPEDDLANHVVPVALDCPALLVLNAARSGHVAAFLGVPQLAATDGIDGLFIGMGDLAMALGQPGNVTGDQIDYARKQVLTATRQHGKLAGAFAYGIDIAQLYLAEGFDVIAFGNDIKMLREGIGQTLAAINEYAPYPASG